MINKTGLTALANGQSNFLNANATFAQLNQLVQAGAIDKDLTAPPGSPADEVLYIVGASATGAWAGHDGELAYWLSSSGAWLFATPREGWLVHVNDEGVYYKYTGSAWAVLQTGGGGWDTLLTPASSSGVLTASLAEPAGLAVTLTEDITDIDLTDIPTGKVVVFSIKWVQNGTGGWGITWPAAFQGTPAQPATAAGAVTIQSFYTDDGGATIYQAS